MFHVLSMLLKNCKKTVLLLTETLQTTLQFTIIFKIVHIKMSHWYESKSFPLQYCTFSPTTMSSRSLPFSLKGEIGKIKLLFDFLCDSVHSLVCNATTTKKYNNIRQSSRFDTSGGWIQPF